MGLDITAYTKLTPVENPQLDENGQPVDWPDQRRFGINPDFPTRESGLLLDPHHRSNWQHTIVYTTDQPLFHFRAGSYGGYNLWRNHLAQMAGWEDAQEAWAADGGPFWELISFSDCEGVIGPVVSAKLHDEFVAHIGKAEAYAGQLDAIEPGDGQWFLQKYNDWMKAFELAKDNGAVSFH